MMEYAEDGTLKNYLLKNDFSEQEILYYYKQIL